jgi:hypothetical protein
MSIEHSYIPEIALLLFLFTLREFRKINVAIIFQIVTVRPIGELFTFKSKSKQDTHIFCVEFICSSELQEGDLLFPVSDIISFRNYF